MHTIGFPSEEGVHYIASPEAPIGISAAGVYKEGAWSFVRTLLEEPQQEASFSLPIHRASFEQVMTAAMDGDSMWTVYFGEMDIIQEDVDIVRDLLNGVTCAANSDRRLLDIIAEESAAYFAGDKAAEIVAENIQGRTQIYISEQE